MPRGLLFLLIISVSAIFAFSQSTGSRPRASGTPTLKGQTPTSTPAKRPGLTGGSQKAPPQSTKAPTEEADVVFIETNLIQTPVSVLDRNGRFIPNLKKKDFKIFEDGVEQAIELFQTSEQPFTVILMIDISPSTRYKIDEIHYAALTFVNQLRPTDKVMVVAFDQRTRVLSEPTTDRKNLYGAIYASQFGSGTSLYDAVDAVTNLELVSTPGRKAIVLFTDGVDTTSRRASFESSVAGVEEVDALIYPIRYNTMAPGTAPNMGVDPATFAKLPKEAQELLARASNMRGMQRGQSYTEYERGKSYLEALAANSGGRMFEADTISNMETAFSGVAEELRRQYSVGYYSNKEGVAGERKHIKIKVARPGAVVRSKTTYIVKEKDVAKPSDGSN
jgi:Ca-activated chloride channel family protein